MYPRLTMQVWDKEIVCPNVAIGEVVLPLQRLCKRALVTNKRTFYTVKGEKDFWIKKLKIPKGTKQSKKGKPKLKLRVELVPKDLAEAVANGDGRSQPNMHPFLAPPEGRIAPFDIMHPWQMCYDIIGPNATRKICCAIFVIVLLGCLAYF